MKMILAVTKQTMKKGSMRKGVMRCMISHRKAHTIHHKVSVTPMAQLERGFSMLPFVTKKNTSFSLISNCQTLAQ